MAVAVKKPWFKFYPQDWRGDAKLRSCSIGARGLWAEMLCIMHEATPYGYLLLGTVPVSNRQLASLAGITQKEALTFLAELGSAGVFSRDEKGTIYSRRMVRDHEKSQKGRDDANKRWGNGECDRQPTQTPNGVPLVDPITLEARSQIDSRGSAGASVSVFTEGSKALTDALWQTLGFKAPLGVPNEFAGVDYRAVEWEKAGWTVDLIVTVARKLGTSKPLNYYEKVLATEFAKRQTPLPKVEIREAEKVIVHGKPKSSVTQAIDDLNRAIAGFDGPARGPDQLRGDASQDSPRLLPHG
jgi:hypothetical protein